MLFKRLLYVFIFLFLVNVSYSQSEEDNSKSFIYLNWANDLFVQTDYYFSNGLDLGYIRVSKKQFSLKRFDFASFNHYSIVQDFFTPTNLNIDTILPNDRPYAAYLVGSFQKHFFDKKNKIYFNPEIMAGVLGPAALGSQLQHFTHEISPPSKPPQGWNNQISNDLAINLNVQLEKSIFQNEKWLVNLFSEGRLGTLYTDLSAGARFRVGKFNDFFQSYQNISLGKAEKWQLFFEFQPSVKLVGYNATLQGGVFNETSPYTIEAAAIERLVTEIDLSLNASYKNFNLKYMFSWNSKEFEMATPHQWITISLGWAF